MLLNEMPSENVRVHIPITSMLLVSLVISTAGAISYCGSGAELWRCPSPGSVEHPRQPAHRTGNHGK